MSRHGAFTSAGAARRGALALTFTAGLASPASASDEIQVYNAEINDPGQFSIQLHNNYGIKGKKEAPFPGGLVPNHTLNGTPEFAYGVNDAWELGLYLPYAVSNDQFHQGGFKLRTLFVSPHAHERHFFYGANFELSWQPLPFEENRWNLEVRPIVGVRFQPIEFIVNPIVDTSFGGAQRVFELLPAARLAYIVSEEWAAGFEHYSDLGPADRVPGFSRQDHTLFAVVDYSGEPVDVNFGIGRGYTGGSADKWIAKMILGRAF